MNIWSRDPLWQKAKLYVRRALAEDREGSTFGLWATLGLEFVARSTLAHIHPALLADPREPENILYAFGYPSLKSPKSIPAKALFARCEVVIADFTLAERNFAMTLIERRNEELHNGSPAFHEFASSEWLGKYFRVCDILVRGQQRGLGHLVGGDEARVARRMIAASQSSVRNRILSAIATLGAAFHALPETQQAERSRTSGLKSRANALGQPFGRRTRCPACNSFGFQVGQRVRSSEPIADEDAITVRTVVLPTQFECFACGLKLSNHSEMHFAELGDQYTESTQYDPAEFYGLEYVEPPLGRGVL